jgi:hypothetical protein
MAASAKVQMKGAPKLDRRERFDVSRIRLGDIDGSVVADLIYLGPDKVRNWFNQSGNSWSVPYELPQFPGIEDPGAVSLVDLLGDGTQCLVWSSG